MPEDNNSGEQPLTYGDLCKIWEKSPEKADVSPENGGIGYSGHEMNKKEITRKFEEILENLKKILSEREDSEKK